MSRRKRKSEQADFGFYPTPPDVVFALRLWLEEYSRREGWFPPYFFDPAAGPGLLLEFITDDPSRRFGCDIDGRWRHELAGRCASSAIADSLKADDWNDPAFQDVMRAPTKAAIATNPPFNLALSFVNRAIAWADVNETAALFLLRSNWLQVAERTGVPMPDVKLDLTWRPSFTADGGNDSSDYSWFVWFGALNGERVVDDARPTQLYRLERPTAVSGELVDLHARMARRITEDGPRQQSFDLEQVA